MVWHRSADKSAEEQIGEQIRTVLLLGARVVGQQAPGDGGEHAIDSGGINCGSFTSDIPHTVRALYDSDAAFGQGAAMPLSKRERFQLHDEPEQPDAELFR